MRDLLISAMLGLARTLSAAVIIILLTGIIIESTAMGITLAVALAVQLIAARQIRRIESHVSDDTADDTDGEEDYTL